MSTAGWDNLRESPVATALISGLLDTVNPVRIAKFDRVAAFQGCVQAFGGIRHGDKMLRVRGGPGEGEDGSWGYRDLSIRETVNLASAALQRYYRDLLRPSRSWLSQYGGLT